MRLHGSRPTFRWFHRSRDSLLPYSKQCPSINAHLRFAICARKGSAALGPLSSTRTRTDRVRDTKFSLARYSHTSVFSEWTLFFFLRGDDATFVTRRTKLRSTQEPSLLVLGPCSSLVPPRLTEGKIKIINVSFDAWTFSLTGKRREIN